MTIYFWLRLSSHLLSHLFLHAYLKVLLSVTSTRLHQMNLYEDLFYGFQRFFGTWYIFFFKTQILCTLFLDISTVWIPSDWGGQRFRYIYICDENIRHRCTLNVYKVNVKNQAFILQGGGGDLDLWEEQQDYPRSAGCQYEAWW